MLRAKDQKGKAIYAFRNIQNNDFVASEDHKYEEKQIYLELKKETIFTYIITLNKQFIKIINTMQNQEKGNIKDLENALSIQQKTFYKKLDNFVKIIQKWKKMQGLKEVVLIRQSLIQYAKYLIEVNNNDRITGPCFINTAKNENQVIYIRNEKELFVGTNFLENSIWKVNFNELFIQKLQKFSQKNMTGIFFRIYLLQEGYFNFNEEEQPYYLKNYETKKTYAQNYYTTQIEVNKNIYYMLVSIAVHCVPYYFQGKVQLYQHIMMLTVQDIVDSYSFHNKKQMDQIIQNIEKSYERSPRMNYQRKHISYDKKEFVEKLAYYHERDKVDNTKMIRIYPTIFKKIFVSDLVLDEQSYNQNHQQLNNSSDQSQRQHICPQEKEDQWKMIKGLQIQAQKNRVSFNNAEKILYNLLKTPNFKYSLTNQQRQLLQIEGNLIIIGRSGTGKTTCAMLRLYGIEFAVKFNQFNSLRRLQLVKITKKKCLLMAINQIKLMKNVFLTFSSTLIDQIKKKYDDMLYQINKKHSRTCDICKKTFKRKEIFGASEDPIDKEKRIIKQQQRKLIELSKKNGYDVSPEFFTTSNFIRIIDKAMKKPFFSYDKRHNKLNRADQLIKNEFINRYRANTIIQVKQAVCVDFNFFRNHFWKIFKKDILRLIKDQQLLNPSVIWAQIFSIIKGSLNSYLEPQKYLSLQAYIDDHRSIFQKQGEKRKYYKKTVYQIFKIYQNWCKNDGNAFDFMDVINHILSQLEQNPYQGPMINYMFIDEVQDLTASTIFLLSKIVLNNVFYCGDTAQAITKGVSFRFDDIDRMFHSKNCRNPLKLKAPGDVMKLTVNFRSHNLILQLANSVVSMIQKLFPRTIEKIAHQKSDLIGPKTYIIQGEDENILLHFILGNEWKDQFNEQELLNDSQNQEQNYNEQSSEKFIDKFNSRIIIVRDEQSKQSLPSYLQDLMIFTPQTVKGLQFQEVILYNFFSKCPLDWNVLLAYLKTQNIYQKQQSFEKQLSRRNEQQGIINKLSEEIKRSMGYDPIKKSYKKWSIETQESFKNINANLYYEMVSQLKILYTAITRAKNAFIIYDSNIPRNLLKIWSDMDLITFVKTNNVQQCYQQKEKYFQNNINDEKQEQISYDKKEIPNQHLLKMSKKQRKCYTNGCKMYQRKDYYNSKKCFRKIKRNDIAQRIDARELQIQAEYQLFRIEDAYKRLQKLPRDDRKITKIRLQHERINALDLYLKAGRIYEKYSRYNDAAEAYFKAERYQLSLKYNQISKIIHQQDNKDSDSNLRNALCLKKLKRYGKAAQTFQQSNDIQALVQCYNQQKNWDKLSNILIENIQQIDQSPKLIQFGRNCIKSILSNIIENQLIKNQIQNFKYYYGFDLQWQLNDKKIHRQNQISVILQKLSSQIQYQNLKSMHYKLQKRFKSSKQKDYMLTLSRMLQSSIRKHQTISQERHHRQQFDQQDNQERYSVQDSEEQMQGKYNYQLPFKDYDLDFDQQFDPNLIIEDDDAISIYTSEISEMTYQYQQNQTYIGGLSLTIIQKQNLIQEINQKLKEISQLVAKYVFFEEEKLSVSHHNYMEQRLIKQLVKNSTKGLQTIIVCSKVESHLAALLFCDYYKELTFFSPKHILGYLLKDSLNFKEERHFSKEIYQVQIANWQHQTQEQSNIEQFLASLSNNGLLLKVPRLGLKNKLYYETILSSLLFGLVLQGYFKKLFIFCERNTSLKLAYLSFNCEEMKKILIDIANQLGLKKQFDNKEYFFTQENQIINFCPQTSIINVFFYQQIFCSYDQYQLNPWLSKKKLPKDIDIEEDLVRQFYNQTYKNEIQKMRLSKLKFQRKIEQLYKQNEDYRRCLKNKRILDENTIQKLQNEERNKFKKELQFLQKKIQPLKQQLKFRQTEYNVAQRQMNQTTLSKKKKEQYFNQIEKYKKLRQNLKDQKSIQIVANSIGKYEDILQTERQAYLNHQKKRLRFKQKQEQFERNQMKLKQIYLRLSSYSYNLHNLSFQQASIYYERFIKENQILIDDACQQIPNQLQIEDQQELKQAKVKRLMKQEKNLRCLQNAEQIRIKNINKINKSNLPKINSQKDHYQFLNLYLRDQLTQKNLQQPFYQKVSNIYYEIIMQGNNIDLLFRKRGKRNAGNIKICNIILFFLSFLFNEIFREGVNRFLDKASEIYKENEQKRKFYKEHIRRLQNLILYYQKKLKSIPPLQKTKQNQDYNNCSHHLPIHKAQLEQYQSLTKNYQLYPNDPRISLFTFLKVILKRIKKKQGSNSYFMELLFGFFQCRLIKDCKILHFLQNQYALVKKNSIVVQELLKNSQDIFAYYLDNENETILCRFIDIQETIVKLIQTKLKDTCKIIKISQNRLEEDNDIQPQQFYTYNHMKQEQENKQILKIIQHLNKQKFQDIQQTFNMKFVNKSLLKDIKRCKRDSLQYLFKHQHTNSDQYNFAEHQIREYHFLEKMMERFTVFNYEAIKEVQEKKISLKEQFNKFTNKQR